MLVAAYLIAVSVVAVRAGDIRPWPAVGRVVLFLAVMPLASLPILIPRLAFIGSSSLHRGYDALGQPVRAAGEIQDRPLATNGVWAAWPLAFGVAPGAYVGAVMLLAVPFALRDRTPARSRLGVRRLLRAHMDPDAERGRDGGVVPAAHAQAALRRRVPA